MVSAIKAAIGDTVLTFMWVFFSSMLGLVTNAITKVIDLHYASYQGLDYPSIIISTLLIFSLVFIFTIIGNVVGGASFNLTGNASFYVDGFGSDTLFSTALRFPTQALGVMGSAMAIMEVMRLKYKHMIVGPTLKVDLNTGAIVEGFLAFVIIFVVLFIMLRDPRSDLGRTWLMMMSTVALIVLVSIYTGPAMNPAITFGWAYLDNWHNTWDQFYVYWISLFIGAILAAWLFHIVFPPQAAKQKKA